MYLIDWNLEPVASAVQAKHHNAIEDWVCKCTYIYSLAFMHWLQISTGVVVIYGRYMTSKFAHVLVEFFSLIDFISIKYCCLAAI